MAKRKLGVLGDRMVVRSRSRARFVRPLLKRFEEAAKRAYDQDPGLADEVEALAAMPSPWTLVLEADRLMILLPGRRAVSGGIKLEEARERTGLPLNETADQLHEGKIRPQKHPLSLKERENPAPIRAPELLDPDVLDATVPEET